MDWSPSSTGSRNIGQETKISHRDPENLEGPILKQTDGGDGLGD